MIHTHEPIAPAAAAPTHATPRVGVARSIVAGAEPEQPRAAEDVA
jgi:hypothetical protein